MQGSRRIALTDADTAAWAAFARHIRLLPGRRLPEPPTPAPGSATSGGPRQAEPPAAPPGAAPAARAAPIMRAVATLAVGAAPAGVDGASWRRLREGRLRPERTLDLHGRTAQAAHQALHTFLRAAHADRVRCVEVITGRGSGESGGVIRRELPMWLNLPTLRPLVLAAVHPHPANAGAVRLLLRRTR